MCDDIECSFDRIRLPANKKLLANHVTNTDGLWLNMNNVRPLIDQAYKLKLEVALVHNKHIDFKTVCHATLSFPEF